MSADTETMSDPLYHSNRLKVNAIIRNYNPCMNGIHETALPPSNIAGNDAHTMSNEELLINGGMHKVSKSSDVGRSSLENSSTLSDSKFERPLLEKEKIINKWWEFSQSKQSKLSTPEGFEKCRSKKKFVEMVMNGIPEVFRINFWSHLLSVKYSVDHEFKYDDIKYKSQRFARLEDVFQIDKDVQRTFRDREEFREDYSKRQCMLFNVLLAYSFFNDKLGYCQGMHQCAGLLLLYSPDEQGAFWGLHRLMIDQRYTLHGMFIYRFPKYIRLRDEFEKILRKKVRHCHYFIQYI